MISPFQAIPVAKVFCGINYGVHLQTPTSRRGRASVFVPQGEVPTLNTRRSFHGHGRGWDSPRSTFIPFPRYRGRTLMAKPHQSDHLLYKPFSCSRWPVLCRLIDFQRVPCRQVVSRLMGLIYSPRNC